MKLRPGDDNLGEKLMDVALTPPEKELQLALESVGMENVQTQVCVKDQRLPARVDVAVSLIDPQARGIHMSRLYKIVTKLNEQELTWSWLTANLKQILESQRPLSDAAHLQVAFDLPVLRGALLSEEKGWRNYPVIYRVAHADGRLEWTLNLKVLYSSTCPCSAALARQAIQEQFRHRFGDGNIPATDVTQWLQGPNSIAAVPHSQRSEASCEFTFEANAQTPSALTLIDAMEAALKTPVQAAVKREDEQEFARLNAGNLMFCEDAARKLKAVLLKLPSIHDFKIEVRHFESLHPHDVVARVRK